MKIRYLVAFGLLMLAVVVGLYLLTGFTPTWEPAVSEENFLLVHKGMTLQEVEEILGPGRDMGYHFGMGLLPVEWRKDRNIIHIWFRGESFSTSSGKDRNKAEDGYMTCSNGIKLRLPEKPQSVLEAMNGFVRY